MKKLLVFIFAISPLALLGQTNIDSIFNRAIAESRSGNYDNAFIEARKALKADSLRADIYVFSANVLSWKNKNDSALIYISKASNLDYKTEDFYDAYLNILYRSKKFVQLDSICKEAQQNNYKNKNNLTAKKLLAFEGLEEYKKIVDYIEAEKNEEILKDEAIKYIYETAKQKTLIQSINTNYSIDIFENMNPHHLVSVGYSNKNKKNTYGFVLNYANRYGKNDIQAEYVGYKILKNDNYWYLNYGYGFGTSLFPKHRTGLEYYFKLSHYWEASIGGRYLFYPLASDKNIWICTTHIGTYIKKNWISIRPFYVLKKDLQSLSVAAKYRLYDNNPMSFWGVELGLGNSPDDMYATSQGAFNELLSYRIRMEKNIPFEQHSEILFGVSYVYEEILQNTVVNNRNRFIIDISYRYKF